MKRGESEGEVQTTSPTVKLVSNLKNELQRLVKQDFAFAEKTP